jgi:hypothetical protein
VIRELVRADRLGSRTHDEVRRASVTDVVRRARRAPYLRQCRRAHDQRAIARATRRVRRDVDLCSGLSALRGTRSQVERSTEPLRGEPGARAAQLVLALDRRL